MPLRLQWPHPSLEEGCPATLPVSALQAFPMKTLLYNKQKVNKEDLSLLFLSSELISKFRIGSCTTEGTLEN